jgi:hypothetical protein
MRTSALQEIMIGVEDLPIPYAYKAHVLRLVSQVGLLHGVSGIERIDRMLFARGLLKEKLARDQIRDRLISVYHVSRRQAYRIIQDAL